MQSWSELSSKLENLLRSEIRIRPTRSFTNHSHANKMSDVVKLANVQFRALLRQAERGETETVLTAVKRDP